MWVFGHIWLIIDVNMVLNCIISYRFLYCAHAYCDFVYLPRHICLRTSTCAIFTWKAGHYMISIRIFTCCSFVTKGISAPMMLVIFHSGKCFFGGFSSHLLSFFHGGLRWILADEPTGLAESTAATSLQAIGPRKSPPEVKKPAVPKCLGRKNTLPVWFVFNIYIGRKKCRLCWGQK